MITSITFKPRVYVNYPLTGQFGVRQNYSTTPNINSTSHFHDTVSFSRNEKKLTSQSLSDKEFKALVGQKIKQATPATKMDVASELTEVLDLYLQGKWDDKAQPNKRKIVLAGLKKLLGEQGQGNIVMAQINPIPGNIEANAKKAMAYIRAAEAIGADAIIFPEEVLTGYTVHDLINRHPIIVDENMDWLQEMAKQTGKTKVIIGFTESRKGEKEGKAYYNSAATLGDGKVLGVTRKSLLPTYDVFNDYRYHEPSPVVGNQPPETLGHFGRDKVIEGSKLSDIHGYKGGIVICEDGWNGTFFDKQMYPIDPVEEIAKEEPDMIINLSASPTRTKKEQLKNGMLSYDSQKYKIPMVYVNQVGAIDEISFDGSSRVYNANGDLIARAKSFEEQFMVVNPLKSQGKTYPLARGLKKTLKEKKIFTLNYEPDLDRTYKTVIQGIRDYFEKSGGLKKAVIGLSGGLDSSVTAVLLADTLGPENVCGVSMPAKITSNESKNDAKILAENLGIKFHEGPILDMVQASDKNIQEICRELEEEGWEKAKNSYTQDNIQARARSVTLHGIANEMKSTLAIATSDKSELYMGYATINGDMSGGFAPIADITKTKLFALARWLNKNREGSKNVIPESVILKSPGAELAIDPKTKKALVAEDAMMPYAFMDEIIWRVENKAQSFNEILKSNFLFEKMAQGDFKPKNEYEQDALTHVKKYMMRHYGSEVHVLTKSEKRGWLETFFKRMTSPLTLYKWSILPPSVIVDAHSIIKAEYKQPIVSGGFDYKGQALKAIAKKLKQIK